MVEKKTKQMGLHKVVVKKYLDEKGDAIVCEVEINKSLRDLLSHFTVDGFVEEEWGGMKIKRCKIKKVLRSSFNWDNLYGFFFQKCCLDSNKFKIEFENIGCFDSFLMGLRRFRDFLKDMEELAREETIVVSYKVER